MESIYIALFQLSALALIITPIDQVSIWNISTSWEVYSTATFY